MVDGVQTLDSRERHCRVAKKKSNLQILGLCQSLGKFKGDHWSSVSLAQKVGRKSVLAPRELIALDRVCDAASVTISVRWVGFLVGHVNFQVLKLKSRQGRLLTADVKVAAAKKRFSAQETKLQTHLTKKAESLRRLWSLEFWTAYCQPVKIFWKLDTPVTPNSKTDNKEGIGDRWIPTRSGFPNVDGVSLSNAYAGRLQVVWEWRGRSDVGTWGREPGRLGFVEIA
ncbi:hypothetical protein Landi51_11780 [Colletotrichum acutatum]